MASRRAVLAGAICLALRPDLVSAQAGPAEGQGQIQTEARTGGLKSVVELFTSQGCSSCPPADALLGKLAERPDVIALTFPVDYWDHLGWKDTLASPKNARRQKHYAKALGPGNVYTPQVVINGAAQAVGSNRAEIERGIEQTRRDGKSRVNLAGVLDGDKVKVSIGTGAGADPSATVWLAVIVPRVEVEIRHGENRGRKLIYTNVVRELAPVSMWSGAAINLDLPREAMLKAGERCAVIVQAGETGRIIAADWVDGR